MAGGYSIMLGVLGSLVVSRAIPTLSPLAACFVSLPLVTALAAGCGDDQARAESGGSNGQITTVSSVSMSDTAATLTATGSGTGSSGGAEGGAEGAARKNQVQEMVMRLLSLNSCPTTDAADALACAICHAHGGFGLGKISTGSYRMKRGRLV